MESKIFNTNPGLTIEIPDSTCVTPVESQSLTPVGRDCNSLQCPSVPRKNYIRDIVRATLDSIPKCLFGDDDDIDVGMDEVPPVPRGTRLWHQDLLDHTSNYKSTTTSATPIVSSFVEATVSVAEFLGNSTLRDVETKSTILIYKIKGVDGTAIIKHLVCFRDGQTKILEFDDVFEFFRWTHEYRWYDEVNNVVNSFDAVNNVVIERMIQRLDEKNWNEKPIVVLTKVKTSEGTTDAQLYTSNGRQIMIRLMNTGARMSVCRSERKM
ncbi:hypothetical protein BMW23_0716 [Bodo saltans virus]|uniref:Uncharacterized protein n=1 Tax=Bodo saltans virus TaxID=2024608 RepID=A0A2H4UV09_9VIRU|nr:hypothetical protein QJ851_gp0699 [Bodo saltans virus]ATZ80762.1 hypothetical protein BMW23_0716 [Bodo saltans virus]